VVLFPQLSLKHGKGQELIAEARTSVVQALLSC